MVRTRCVVLLTGIVLGLAPAGRALAQSTDPPGPYVIDTRVTLPSYAPTDAQAVALGLEKAQLPKRGLGFELGAHVYPLRRGGFALGIGGSYLKTRGTAQATTAALATDPDAIANAPKIETRFTALMPTLSLNFGHRAGWSYISGGLGTSRRGISQVEGTPTVPDAEDSPRVRTLSYGGGARWFMNPHMAFGFDLRWYKMSAQEASATTRAFPAQTFFVANVGLSFR